MYLSRLRRTVGALLLSCLGVAATSAGLSAQEAYTIQGRVVDATTQQPLPNAAVQLRGTQLGALTNQNGQFTLSARVLAGTYTLSVSLVGRGQQTREITLGADHTVSVGDIALRENALELEEIVVTGTGAPTERRALGNSIATVSGEAVNESPAAQSIDKALQGKITGAIISQNNGQPGGGTSIRLRGTGSILGGAEPLIVIDGVIVENSTSALIGLGANATYSQSALSNSLSDIAPGDIERVEVIKGAAAAALYGSRANAGVIQIFTKRGRQGAPQVTYRVEGATTEVQEYFNLNESPVANRGDVLYGGASAIGAPVERFLIQDDIFRTGNAITNQLSVTGGAEAGSYYASAYWRNETGIIRGSALSNVNVRGSVTQQLADWLEVTLGGNYIEKQGNYVPEGEQTQGVITSLIFTPTSVDPTFDPETGRYPYNPLLGANPLDVIENWRAEQDVNRFIGNFTANIRPIEDLRINYIFGLDRGSEEFTYLQPPRSTSPAFGGSIQNPIREIRRFNNDLTATYDRLLGESFGTQTTLGFRQTVDNTNIVRAAASSLPPQQETVGGATQSAEQFVSDLRTVGGFVQERLGLNDRLFLTVGLNADASSAFGEDERWQFFPRAGASWVVTEEPFWSNLGANFVSTLRLRASYGETGGQPPTVYDRFDNYVNVSRGGLPGLIPSSIAGNENLKPERQREYEAGFDLGLFNDRASLDFTYYDKYTTDLVLLVSLPRSSGYTQQYQNVGELSNKGVELALNTINVSRSNFEWSSRLSYAANRERVEKLVSSSDTLLTGYLNYVIEGQPVGVFYTAYYPRDANGNIIAAGARDGRGFPIAGTEGVLTGRARGFDPARGDSSVILRKIVGSPTPDFTINFSNDFRIGDNLEVSVLFDGRFGNEVANFSRRISELFAASPANNDEVCLPGPPVRCQLTLNSDRGLTYEEFVEDGSFVKLREAAIRYNIPDQWAERAGVGNVQLSLSGRNLYTWTDYTGIDPEVNLFSANTVARGVEFGTSPIPRYFALGLTVNF